MVLKKYYSFIICVLFVFSCGDVDKKSNWVENEIKIDAQLDEWEGLLQYDKEENAAFGIQNNDKYLYLCLVTNDRKKIMPILMMGFTVWFEPEEGRTLGIKYPLQKNHQMPTMDNIDKKTGVFNENINFEKLLSTQVEFLVINEDEYPLYQFNLDDSSEYKVKISIEKGKMIYEAKIPIGVNPGRYKNLETFPGETLELNFATGEFERPNKSGGGMRGITSGQGGRGDRDGGITGGGGRRGGRPGMGRETARPDLDPIDIAFEVKLANKK